jgi:hypothetical protein
LYNNNNNNNNNNFFWGIPLESEFYMPTFWNTVCSIVIGCVDKKNKWDKIARLFIQVKVWLKRSLGQPGGGMGRGRVRVEKLAVDGNGHRWRPVVRQVHRGETAPCWSVEGEP